MKRLIALAALVLLLSACGGFRDDLTKAPEPIGDYRMGYGLAVAPEPQKGPFSRNAEEAEWKAALETSLEERFSRFRGDTYYHIGVAVEGYVLAQPGIPVVYTPKSILIFSMNVFRDETGERLNGERIRLTVFEPCCAVPLLGSGLTRTKEEQLEGLSFNAAKAVEAEMRKHPEWFGGAPLEEGAGEAAEPDAPSTGA